MALEEARAIDVEGDPLEAAHRLAPLIRDAAAEIEAQRRLTPAVVEALRGAGLFHMTAPRSIGGQETDPVTHLRVIETIAAADGSTGWCLMIAAQAGALAAYLEPDVARQMTRHGAIWGGVARPVGRATPITQPFEGYRVSGRWPFASGSSHAAWLGGEALIYDGDGDEPRQHDDGSPITVMFLVAREQVTLHDTWYSAGLRGTASNDFSLDAVDVPIEHVVDLEGGPRDGWPLLTLPALVYMNHGAHALGIAGAAVTEATNMIRAKRGWGGVPLQETGRMQQVIAEATAMYEAAHAYFYSAAERLWAAAQSGTAEVPAVDRARGRLAASHAANESVRTVDHLHRALATSAIMSASPLDRQFRDLHTAAAHVMIGPLTYEAAGRVLLGREAAFPLF